MLFCITADFSKKSKQAALAGTRQRKAELRNALTDMFTYFVGNTLVS